MRANNMRLVLAVIALILGVACLASAQNCPGGQCPRPVVSQNGGIVPPWFSQPVLQPGTYVPFFGDRGIVPTLYRYPAGYPYYYVAPPFQPTPTYYYVPSYNLPYTGTRLYPYYGRFGR
jgi:hypothetical protein